MLVTTSNSSTRVTVAKHSTVISGLGQIRSSHRLVCPAHVHSSRAHPVLGIVSVKYNFVGQLLFEQLDELLK